MGAADRCAESTRGVQGEARRGRTGKRELLSGRLHLSPTLVLLQSRRSEPDRTGFLSPLRSQQPGPNPKGSGSGHGTPPPGPRPRGELAVPPPRRPPAEAKFPWLPLFPGRGGGPGALGAPTIWAPHPPPESQRAVGTSMSAVSLLSTGAMAVPKSGVP